ncbi:ankyrin repeat domain-containing protein [Mucilaginibacter sp. BJC16-A38]|uniref:ankyrin repeat domain-containing protein n=1 Tax=Mucilaginibacter phenanthrenivorans TaxID=1234842 RepID=UPI0021573C38|nr:ankyrin repeat domain-containing protein [Mucilaginibacter phenanthrenivorans]MCR8561393.1 ankyrin repeat domain-containing protein [Mucilaginibacter phenanthrenivorans]
MKNTDITDPQFLQAVEAIDAGDINELETIITKYPRLVKERLQTTEPGYFKDPYLLWFVADNPIRIEKLPPNIVEITSLLVQAVKREAPDTYLRQINYTLGLVVTGRIPRECGVQIAMMDLLIDAGAAPAGTMGAFAHGNIDAAQHLINRGDKLTLPAAVCLERMDDINRLGIVASAGEKLTSLTAAAFYGKSDIIKLLLKMGADPNGYSEHNSGFHSHATPLHQAVYSGSLDAVKILLEAGAKPDAPDKIYNGTPLGWARHMQTDDSYDEAGKNKFAVIESYLLSLS